MTVNHDAVAALPSTGPANKALVRNLLTARMPYVLADGESATNLVAVDPATGAAIEDIMFLGRVFHYDPTDATTANDGTSCLVSAEGRRYKLASGTDVFAYAVLDNTLAAPPGSPSLGDAYLVAASATGAWAGKSGQVAVNTRRGWEFVVFGIGRFIYVENADAYYHKNSSGVWVVGLGNQTLAPGAVTLQNVLGAAASFVIKVENQVTNTPPASPSPPTAYIIGPAPTGAWAGNAGKLAMCLVSGAWTIINPVAGDTVYDKAQANSFRFDGAAWISSTGVWVGRSSVFSAGGAVDSSLLGASSNVYTYSATVAPTSTKRQAIDTATALTYAAKKAGAILRFQYTADCHFSPGTSGVAPNANPVVVALFRDSEVNAVAWKVVGCVVDLTFANILASSANINDIFEIAASDAAYHTYRVAIISGGHSTNGQSLDNGNLTRRTFSVQEAA